MSEHYIKSLLINFVKPLLKEAFQEFLNENQLTMVSTKPLATDKVVGTKDALELFGRIDRHTLYKYIAEGLPAFKVGKDYKFKVEDINLFIEQKRK